MTLSSFLNNRNFKLKRMFVYGMIAIIVICALSTISAIISGSYPENFLSLIFSAVALEWYFINCIFCLKIHDRCKQGKIPYDWIGVALCTVTLVIVLLRIWTNIPFTQSFAIPAVLLTVSYTIAILPVTLQIDNHRKLSKFFGIMHRIVTPLFGVIVAINFLVPTVYSYLQTVTWTVTLIEILIVTVILLLYSKPFTAHIVLYETGTPNIYTDASGHLYQLISMNVAPDHSATEVDFSNDEIEQQLKKAESNDGVAPNKTYMEQDIPVTESGPVIAKTKEDETIPIVTKHKSDFAEDVKEQDTDATVTPTEKGI